MRRDWLVMMCLERDAKLGAFWLLRYTQRKGWTKADRALFRSYVRERIKHIRLVA